MMRTLLLLLSLAGGLALPIPTADAAKRVPCPDGSYVVIGRRLLPGTGDSDQLTVRGRELSLASGCAAKRGRVKATKVGTKLLVKWKTCGEQKKVALRGLIDQACQNLSGTIKWKGSGSQSFTGVELSLIPPTTTTSTTAPGSSTTSTTLFTGACTPLSLENVKNAVAAGGTYEFCDGGSVTLDQTLVVGTTVTLLGPFTDEGRGVVSYRRELGTGSFRLFHVESGGSLTLDGAALSGGQALGGPGFSSDDVADATAGAQGTPHQLFASNGGPGGTGSDGNEVTPATDGGAGQGGAVLIDAGGSALLRNCAIEGNTAGGGRGGDAGNARRAGDGGPGGDGGTGAPQNGGAGGVGGFPGAPVEGEDGGAGGSAEGGAIHNAGVLTVDGCRFANNFATAGLGGDAGWGGSGGAGGNGGRGGVSNSTNASDQPYNGGKGGHGGDGENGNDGKDGGRGGDGGSAAGGAIFSSGSLTLIDVVFRNNGAFGAHSGNGGSGGAGGSGGSGSAGASGNPCGDGGDGGTGGSGGNGGSNGNGGGGFGGAVYSTGAVSLTDVTFVRSGNGTPTNTVGGGSGGINNCTPGDTNCFGDGGEAGAAGPGAPGGSACFAGGLPGGPMGAAGMTGVAGSAGAPGGPGAPGLAGDPECHAGGASCAP